MAPYGIGAYKKLQVAPGDSRRLQMVPEAPMGPRAVGEHIHTGKVSDF
jgi:hypothetical protein